MKKKILSVLFILVLMASMLIGLTACGDSDDEDEKEDKAKEVAEEIYNDSKENTSKTSDDLEDEAKEVFNAKFKAYEGQQTGSSVKNLLEIVIANNMSEDKTVSVTYLGEEYIDSDDISGIRTKIPTAKKFDVSFEYKSGIITEIIIK